MDKQVMIDKIYEIIADKTLSFGCKILRTSNDGSQKIYYALEPTPFGKLHISSMPFGDMIIEVDPDGISKSSGDEYRIIGNKVMIGDVLDWMDDKNIDTKYIDGIEGDDCGNLFESNRPYILDIRKEKRKPLENQSEDAILFIYNLINE